MTLQAGDKVKFIGDMEGYTREGRRNLQRTGEIMPQRWGETLRKGEVNVRWMPKTKRGYPAIYRHNIAELAKVEETEKPS